MAIEARSAAGSAFRKHVRELRKARAGACTVDVHGLRGTERDHPRLLESLLAVCGVGEAAQEGGGAGGEAAALGAALDAEVVRR